MCIRDRAKCEEIAIVYATMGGAALGYVTEALLGNHDGHQYIINVDDSDDDIAIVQGSETLIKNGERVVIIFGKTIIDKSSLDIISGSVVDFKKEMIGESFVIDNPKATASCGCGLSFSI